MTGKEKQVKNAFIYLIPLIVSGIFPFIVISVFTRILTKTDFGLWGLTQVYAVFANGLTNLGMLTAYERNFFQYRHDKLKSSQLLYSCIGFVLCNFFVVAVLTYLFKGFLAEWVTGSVENGMILFFAFCGQFFQGILTYYLTYFKNTEQASDYSKNIVVFSLLNLLFSIIFVAWFRIGVIGLIYAQLLAGIVVFCILSLKFLGKFRLELNMTILFESISVAYPLTPRILIGVISSQFDKYMIGLLTSIGGVGIYSIGQKVASAIFSFMTAVQNVFAPQVYKKMFDNGENGGTLVGYYLTPFAYVTVAPALFIALFSEEIFYFLTPSDFYEAIDIVILLAMFYALMFFGKQPQLVFAKKTFIVSWLSFFNVGLNIGLNIPFIIKWGALGAAWATFLSGFISGAISFMVSQHYYRIKWEYNKIGLVFFIFLGSAFLMMLLRHFSVSYEFRIIIKSVSLFSYLYLGIKFKIITMENYQLIRNLVR